MIATEVPVVVVPAFDEEERITATLAALAAQTLRPAHVVVVDNASTDGTVAVVEAFARTAPFGVTVLHEPVRGVGAAVDTGFRWAVEQGATRLARTDADCLPDPGWLAAARAGFDDGAEMVCGHLVARRDENGPLGRAGFALMVRAAALFGRVRPAHRRRPDGSRYLAPYRMHAGNNMAITADLYGRCGGMPRRPSPTDREMLNRARAHSAAIVHRRDMVVENSTRRIAAYGVVGSARWYLDRGPGALTPDPR
ncbi:glycosyltransferase family 2 protein [Thalassiella azotivora]